MHDWESLSHVRWDCKYHVVIVPKYRRRALYGEFSPPGCPRPGKCAQQTKCSRTPWWIGSKASKRSPVALVVSPIVRIAAIARSRDMAVATRNGRDFEAGIRFRDSTLKNGDHQRRMTTT